MTTNKMTANASHLLFHNCIPFMHKYEYVFRKNKLSTETDFFSSEKRTKIVLILRNPKDVSVSYYHHHSGINLYDYQGKFEDYLSMFMKGECKFRVLVFILILFVLN